MTSREPRRRRTSRSTLALIRAGHVGPALAVTTFASALSWRSGRGWSGLARVAPAVLAGQAAVGLANDYIDRDRDRHAGRVDKPIVTNDVSERAVLSVAAGCAAACIPLSFLSGRRAGSVHIGAVAAAMSYNCWLKSTAFSPVPYLVAFGALPTFVASGARGRTRVPWTSTLAAALLGAGAHFINTLPDTAHDRATRVRGLPQRMGPNASLATGALLMCTSTTIIATSARPLGRSGALLVAATGCELGGVAWCALRGHARQAWHLTMLIAGTTVALAVARPPSAG